MSHKYFPALEKLWKKEINLEGDDIRVMLVMSNTTADTEKNIATLSAFTTLDEYNGTGYARQALANEDVQIDVSNERIEFHSDNPVFATLGAGTRQAVGMIIYLHVTDDTDSVPIFYVDTGGFPFDGSGSNVTIQKNAEGWAQAA